MKLRPKIIRIAKQVPTFTAQILTGIIWGVFITSLVLSPITTTSALAQRKTSPASPQIKKTSNDESLAQTFPYFRPARKGYYLPEAPIGYATRYGAKMSDVEKEAARKALQASFLTFGLSTEKLIPSHAVVTTIFNEMGKAAKANRDLILNKTAMGVAYKLAMGNAVAMKDEPPEKQVEYLISITAGIVATAYAPTQVPLFYKSVLTLNDGVGLLGIIEKGISGWQTYEELKAHEQLSRPMQKANLESNARQLLHDQSKQMIDLASTDANYAQFVDEYLFQPYVGVSLKSDAYTLAHQSKLSLMGDYFKDFLKPDGSVNLDQEKAEELYTTLSTTLEDTTKKSINLAKRVDQTQGSFVSGGANRKLPSALEIEIEIAYARNQQVVELASASIGLTSTLASFFNPKLGHKIAVVGGAAVKIAGAMNALMKGTVAAAKVASAVAGVTSTLGKIAGVVGPVGQIAGAVLDVVSLFAGGPSTEDVILEQIAALRRQVEELRVQMHERFDRIDENLTIIFLTMDSNFKLMLENQNRVIEELDKIRTDLIKLVSNLDRMESNIYEWINVGFRRDFVRAINFYLGYQKRSVSKTKMSFDTFFLGENEFYSHAKDFSKDALSQNISNRGFEDADLYRELNQFTLARNTTYLFEYARQNLNLPLISNRTSLPNLHDWRMATEAYLLLGRENPEHRANLEAFRLEEIYDEGKRLLSALEAITTTQTSAGPRANRALFDSVINKYKQKVMGLENALNVMTGEFNSKPQNVWANGVDPWKDANQEIAHLSNFAKVGFCYYEKNTPTPLSMPSNILDTIRPYVIADYLGWGKLRICTGLSGTTRRLGPRRQVAAPCDSKSCYSREVYAKPSFQIVAYFDNKVIFNKIFTHDKEMFLYYETGCDGSSPWNSHCGELEFLQANWEQGINLKGKFETLSVEIPVGDQHRVKPGLLQEIIQRFESLRHGYQSELYKFLLERFSQSPIVLTAARELSGAKALLNAYITLGLPQSVETNDVLRALMHGSERLPDESGVSERIENVNEHYEKDDFRQLYQTAIDQLAENKFPEKVSVSVFAMPRVEALTKELYSILGEINRYHQDKQSDPIINNYPQPQAELLETLSHIENTNRVVFLGNRVVAHSQEVTVKANSPQAIQLRAFDVGGKPLDYIIGNKPLNGEISGTAPTLLYTPKKNFAGRDSFTFKAKTSTTESNVATVSLTIANNICSEVGFQVASANFQTSFRSAKQLTSMTQPVSVISDDFNGDGKQDLAIANAGSNTLTVRLGTDKEDFGPPVSFPVGTHPLYIKKGDFDSDSKLDLVVSNYSSNNVTVLLGNGKGGFDTIKNYLVGAGPRGLDVGDFDKDGNLDIAVGNRNSNDVTILRGNGKGEFSAGEKVSVGALPHGLVASDFNKDGNLDLAVALAGASNVAIFLGDGKGRFTAGSKLNVGTSPVSLAAADFNRDGNLDLITANYESKSLSLLLGDGKGGFGATQNFALGHIGFYVTAGDFNQDEIPDVAVAGYNANKVSVLTGNGRDGFNAPNTFTVNSVPVFVMAKDLNADGKMDLTVVNESSNDLSIMFGNESGLVTGAKPFSVAVADFNKDGKLDLVTANQNSNNLSIFLGKGDGTFNAAVNYPVGNKPVFMAIADFDMDNDLDIVVTNMGEGATKDGSLSVLLGDGTGKFTRQPEIRIGGDPFAITTGDFNRDGNLDLAVTDVQSTSIEPNVYILNGDGKGSFSLSKTLTARSTPRFISTVDINKDGILDLIVTNTNSNDVSVFYSVGQESFKVMKSYSVGDKPIYHVLDDFDQDGAIDLAVLNNGATRNLAVMLGADGTLLSSLTNYNLEARPSTGVSGDFDLDGKLDLAIAHDQASGIEILSGNGYGIFNNTSLWGAGFETYSIAKGDFNMDGKPDLVIANYNNNSVSVLLNTTCISQNVALVSPPTVETNSMDKASLVQRSIKDRQPTGKLSLAADRADRRQEQR